MSKSVHALAKKKWTPPRGRKIAFFSGSDVGMRFVVTASMSQPREVVPGATYLITRRTQGRHFLFRPDAAITQLLVYTLAVSAARYDISVHAFCAMSSHIHLVITDARGVLPRFLQYFHRIVALGTKVLRAWEGPVWENEHTSAVRLLTRAAIMEKIAYVQANPVASGLVQHSHEWPGATTRAHEMGGEVLTAPRPKVYFNPKNPRWPRKASIAITLPPMVEADRAGEFRDGVTTEVEQQEGAARRAMQQEGRRFAGRWRICTMSPREKARGAEANRNRDPAFAVGRAQPGPVWREAAAALRRFRAAYRAALAQWQAGIFDVGFPRGTWWMGVFHGAQVCG